MITHDLILKLANKYQTTEVNIRREYFQHLFLSYFYQQTQASVIYFKGGTALRMIYKSPRFSEDLDFSAAYSDIKPIEEAVVRALSQVEKENVKVALIESKETSGGYLGAINFEDQVVLHLQISIREGDKTGRIVTIINDFVPTYTVMVLSKDELVYEKMTALFNRQKARDFYDLYFMLRANLVVLEKRNLLKKAHELLKATKVNFESELKQYLPKSHWVVIRDFRSALEQEIERFI